MTLISQMVALIGFEPILDGFLVVNISAALNQVRWKFTKSIASAVGLQRHM